MKAYLKVLLFLAVTVASSQLYSVSHYYDAAGRLIQIAYPEGSGIIYVYDDNDNLPTINEFVDKPDDPLFDLDGDGTPNYLDDDDDGDGLPTSVELAVVESSLLHTDGDLPGGDLVIEWPQGGAIRMTGPATESYRGTFEWSDFA